MTLAVSSSFVGPIRNWKKSAMIDDLYTDQSGTVTNSPPAPWCSSLLHNPSLSFSGTIIVDDWQLDVRRWDSEVRPSRHSPGRNTQRMLLTGRSGCFESTQTVTVKNGRGVSRADVNPAKACAPRSPRRTSANGSPCFHASPWQLWLRLVGIFWKPQQDEMFEMIQTDNGNINIRLITVSSPGDPLCFLCCGDVACII